MVQDTITIAKLKQLCHQKNNHMTLFAFFKAIYGNKIRKAQLNFCSSLAAYSLVCYIL